MVSSSTFDAMLVCERRRSRTLIGLVVVAYGLAAAAVVIFMPFFWICIFGLAAVIYAVVRPRRPGDLPPLYWGTDGAWRLGDPEAEPLLLDGATWSTSWLILLVLRGTRGCIRIPLARDSLDGVTWRRLRARLHVAGAAAVRLERP